MQGEFIGFQQFIAFSGQFMVGDGQRSGFQEVFEQFCFTLIELFDVHDDYLVQCFPNGSFKVPSTDG